MLYGLGRRAAKRLLSIAVMLPLLTAGCEHTNDSVAGAREATLRQDLDALRKVIDQYTLDKKRSPKSLNEPVSAGYLREIPIDPITHSRNTWIMVQEDIYKTGTGITDVHSGARGTAHDGTPYSSW